MAEFLKTLGTLFILWIISCALFPYPHLAIFLFWCIIPLAVIITLGSQAERLSGF